MIWSDLEGPWKGEPSGEDFLFSLDTDTDYVCALRRNKMGNWCGYACVPAAVVADEVEVHGGVTWSGRFLPDETKQTDEEWKWIGFDCAHAGDLVPGVFMVDSKIAGMLNDHEEYKTFYFALQEVQRMCMSAWQQLEDRWVTD